jgi:hypothetical protein
VEESSGERRAAELRKADEALRAAEQITHPGIWTPAELAALASLRDHQAAQWDALAADLDDRADLRDQEADHRDVKASARTRRARALADDNDPGFPDRYAAAVDRDDAVGDRGDARVDRKAAAESRRRAAAHRKRAADERLASMQAAKIARTTIDELRNALDTEKLIAQGIGLLMARDALTYAEAFRLLSTMSRDAHRTLHDVAARLTAEHVAALAMPEAASQDSEAY